MDSFRNPWLDDGKTFGLLDQIVLYAEQGGFVGKRKSVGELQDLLKTVEEQELSLRFVSLLKEIHNKKDDINKVLLENHCRMLEQKTFHVTNLECLDRRIEMIKELNEHLQFIIGNKQMILKILQQRFVGEPVRMDASYHKNNHHQLFPQIVSLLGQLAKHLDNLKWTSGANFSLTKLDALLLDIMNDIESIATTFHQICQMKENLNEIYKLYDNSRCMQ